MSKTSNKINKIKMAFLTIIAIVLVLIALTWGTSVAARDEQVEILRPNGAGSVTNILGQQPCLGEHWDKVAEVNADDDGSYVWVYQAHEGQDLYSLSNPSGTGVITKVRIYVRGKTDYIGSIKTLIKTHGTSYYDPLMVLPFEYNDWPLTTNYETYHTEYTQNPYTGSAWTWDEIETLEAGVFLFVLSPVPTPGGPESQCTQVYVQVCYTISSGGNQLPVADVDGPYIGNEGSSITFDASGSYDPDGDPLVYQWDFDNDGIWDTEWSSIPTASYTSGDDWSGTAMVEVSDGELTDTDTASVTVNNVAPTADLGNDGPKDEGSAVTVSFSNQYDPGTSDTFTYSFDWDNDGTYDVVDQAGASAQHTWYDEGTGTYTVKSMIKDNDGGYTEYTTDVMVNNVAPTADLGNDGPKDEGSAVTVSFSNQYDPGTSDTFTYSFDWDNDGTYDVVDQAGASAQHTWYDEGTGTYTVKSMIKDNDGGYTEYTTDVMVNNVAPTADLGNDGPKDEGSAVTVSFSNQYDPGTSDTFTYSFDWDNDGTYDVVDQAGASAQHTWYDEGTGTYTVKSMIKDNDGGYTEYTTDVMVNNVAPTADLGNDGPKDEGSAVTVSFSNQYDPGTSDTFTYSFDWDNDGTYDVVDQAGASAQHTWYDEGTGTYTVKGMIKDNDGGYTEYTTDVMVNNVAPTVDAGQDQTVDEGDTVSFLGSFTDLGWLDTHIIEWDFGDGGTATGTLTPTHAYGDNDVYTVTLTVTDDDGGIGTDDTLTVTVNNIAPTVGEISAPLGPVSVGTVVSASAGFTDPGFDETYIAEWNWGDDFPSTGAIRKVEDAYSVTGSHTYDTPGIYTITLTVNDGFKSTSATFQFVVVYDPVGGFVTGGGWIDSPAGAYTPDPSLTGKATFGFVSKYKKGAVTPTGVTEFHFKVADLNFHSDSYDWLVIAGHKAIYKGTGTIDGDGDYGFMLSAIDEKLTPRTDVDMFRIKIWDKDDGDAVVYDNNIGNDDDADLTTEIAGGQIVIHKAKAK